MYTENIKKYLDNLVLRYNVPEFANNDPVQFPRLFTQRKDIEIAAFLTSVISWGRRSMIIKSCKDMFKIMENKPYNYVMSKKWINLDANKNIHRTFFINDFQYLCKGLLQIYSKNESMENLFEANSMWIGIEKFRNEFRLANENVDTMHISNPDNSKNNGSACKRMHLMLRWLVRKDGLVDIGIWNKIDPKDLYIPLDVHVAKVGRDLRLIDRKQNDRKTVNELTCRLREFDAEDPVKYDFALFGYGEENN